MKSILTSLVVLSLGVFIVGCGSESPETSTSSNPSNNSANSVSKPVALPVSLLLKEQPVEALSVIEARKQMKQGEQVVLSGKIAGREKPFVDSRAAFLLVDNNLSACALHCGMSKSGQTACVDTGATLAESILMVQVLDKDGKLIKKSLKDFGGMTENTVVTIAGTYDETSTAENVVINATGFYVTN